MFLSLKRSIVRSGRKFGLFLPPPRPGTNWQEIFDREPERWRDAVAAARGGPKVLIATSIGGHEGLTAVEGLLAAALTLRGAEVHFLLCDEFLPACMQALSKAYPDQQEFVDHGPASRLCANCWGLGQKTFVPFALPIHRYSTLVTTEEREHSRLTARDICYDEIADYRMDGLAVGEHALAGALRYFAVGTLDEQPQAEGVLRRYLDAAMLTTYATRRLLGQDEYACVCFNHGIYVPQGLIGEVARHCSVPVVNWNPAYRKHCFIFSHGDTYHHTLMAEPTAVWDTMPWTPEMEAEIMDYLTSRWAGTRDWIWFHHQPEKDLVAISEEVGIDFGARPTIGMLTNVMWDAQLHYPANAFPSMLEWTLQTIDYFGKRPDLQLLIRVHPAELRGTVPSRQPIVAEIAKAFPNLPGNVYVIPPESQVSSYAAMLECDSVIIYGTKTGVELTSFAVPVIVAGEAWIRNKGVTMDAESVDGYFDLLDRLPLGRRLDEPMTRRARMYAYHFFFRRMIPISSMHPTGAWPPYQLRIKGLDDLLPGREPGLDVICRGILEQAPFIYQAESLMHTKTWEPVS